MGTNGKAILSSGASTAKSRKSEDHFRATGFQGTYVIGEFLLCLVFVAALGARVNYSFEVLEGVRVEVTSSEECLRAIGTGIHDAPVFWFVH